MGLESAGATGTWSEEFKTTVERPDANLANLCTYAEPRACPVPWPPNIKTHAPFEASNLFLPLPSLQASLKPLKQAEVVVTLTITLLPLCKLNCCVVCMCASFFVSVCVLTQLMS